MKRRGFSIKWLVAPVLALAFLLSLSFATAQDKAAEPDLEALIPEVDGWNETEERQVYFPDTLYEYINGAAESYLSYDFEELLVADFDMDGGRASLTLEIYDMGSPANAFGIFSMERFPDNEPVPVGDLGYLEDESLNFVSGRYYVKLIGFGLGEEASELMMDVGKRVAEAVRDKGRLPEPLRFFPKDDLIPRSERYVKRNFMGYDFLHNGFAASYEIDGREVEGFFIEAGSAEEAEEMLGRLLDFFARDKQLPEKIARGYRVKNRYGQYFFVVRVGNVLCGVARVPEGLEEAGEKLLGRLAASLAGPAGPQT